MKVKATYRGSGLKPVAQPKTGWTRLSTPRLMEGEVRCSALQTPLTPVAVDLLWCSVAKSGTHRRRAVVQR